ncbi:MAG: hypothetical protein GWP91_04690 [Rhodobacterales bacterium]|nr:hypothetical protein [Rhodobacterales bacterium]
MLATLFRWGSWVVNRLGDLSEFIGFTAFSLNLDRMEVIAKRRTGLADFGNHRYRAGFEQITRSAQNDGQLNLSGRIAIREHFILALVTRLRLTHALNTQPEIFKQPLNNPVFIVGLPRTGTTFLQRLLSVPSDTRGLAAWEIREPIPGTGRDHRVRDATLALWALNALAPELRSKHHLEAAEAEECVGLFDASGWTPTLWRLCACYGYQRWYFEQDAAEGYRVYRQMLQWLQAQQPHKRLLLKLPNHTGFIDALLHEIPNARIIQTHRDVEPVIASYCSLMDSVHGVSTDHIDPHQLGAASLDLWATHIERNLAARKQLPRNSVFDVDYDVLRTDPMGTVARIHAHFDLPFEPKDKKAYAEAT